MSDDKPKPPPDPDDDAPMTPEEKRADMEGMYRLAYDLKIPVP